jgi:hypothetical protein
VDAALAALGLRLCSLDDVVAGETLPRQAPRLRRYQLCFEWRVDSATGAAMLF